MTIPTINNERLKMRTSPMRSARAAASTDPASTPTPIALESSPYRRGCTAKLCSAKKMSRALMAAPPSMTSAVAMMMVDSTRLRAARARPAPSSRSALTGRPDRRLLAAFGGCTSEMVRNDTPNDTALAAMAHSTPTVSASTGAIAGASSRAILCEAWLSPPARAR